MKRLIRKKNILITGGAGYIGSVLCSIIKKKYYKSIKVFVIDNLSSGKKKYLRCHKFNQFNLSDKYKLNNFFEKNKIDEVVHLAGYTNLRDKNFRKFNENNYLATKHLVDCINKYRIKKFVFASTASVYGNPKKIPIKENDKILPISHYGKSKLKAEEYIIRKSNLICKSIILRFFNASGASIKLKLGEDKNPPEHLIPIILNNLFKKKNIYIYNKFKTIDGTGVRDYIHVEDIALAIIKSLSYLSKSKKNYEIFNLGSQIGESSLSILKKIEKILNKKIYFKFKVKKMGEPNILLASSLKAKKILDWKIKKNITSILKDSVFWEKFIK
tara:strand:- start:2880 stop:3866 length:987 start_codon:yes stop_codon:yes gene_type:complete